MRYMELHVTSRSDCCENVGFVTSLHFKQQFMQTTSQTLLKQSKNFLIKVKADQASSICPKMGAASLTNARTSVRGT